MSLANLAGPPAPPAWSVDVGHASLTPRVLHIEPDPAVRQDVQDRLGIRGHHVIGVASIVEACQAMAEGRDWGYVILNVVIAYQIDRPARAENGLAFLTEMRQRHPQVPIVVTMARGPQSYHLAAAIIQAGAPVALVLQPFPGPDQPEQSLEGAARLAWQARQRHLAGNCDAPRVFTGGVLRINSAQIELLEVPICGNADSGQMRRILDVLCQRSSPGGWMGLTAEALADEIGASGGASVSSTIKAWRTRVMGLLLKYANYTLTETSIIVSGNGAGYRLAKGITVEAHAVVPVQQPIIAAAPVATALPEGIHWNERQVAIAVRLAAGQLVRRKDLEVEFGVTDKTIKRDLAVMKAAGLAEAQGAGSDHLWLAGPVLKQRHSGAAGT